MAWGISSANFWHDYHYFIVLQPELSPLPWNKIDKFSLLNPQISGLEIELSNYLTTSFR